MLFTRTPALTLAGNAVHGYRPQPLTSHASYAPPVATTAYHENLLIVIACAGIRIFRFRRGKVGALWVPGLTVYRCSMGCIV